MTQAIPKRLNCLTRQNTARCICHSSRNHDWQANLLLFKKLINRKQSSFCIKRIKNCFDQKHIGTTLIQSLNLLFVCLTQLLKCHVSNSRIIHVWRNAGSLWCWPYCASNKSWFVWCGKFITSLFR